MCGEQTRRQRQVHHKAELLRQVAWTGMTTTEAVSRSSCLLVELCPSVPSSAPAPPQSRRSVAFSGRPQCQSKDQWEPRSLTLMRRLQLLPVEERTEEPRERQLSSCPIERSFGGQRTKNKSLSSPSAADWTRVVLVSLVASDAPIRLLSATEAPSLLKFNE